MELRDPVIVYTALTNLEAHVVATMLGSNDVPAYAVEDQSGASIWAFGTISQFHKPNVFVDRSNFDKAAKLVLQFEERQRELRNPDECDTKIAVRCEECGKSSMFPESQSGTVQECPKCNAYVDVGELKWGNDVEDNQEP